MSSTMINEKFDKKHIRRVIEPSMNEKKNSSTKSPRIQHKKNFMNNAFLLVFQNSLRHVLPRLITIILWNILIWNGEAQTDTIKPFGINIATFQKYLVTEVESEFNYDKFNPESSADLWIQARSFQWERAFDLQKQDRLSPFLVCTNTMNLSGYQRRAEITKDISDPGSVKIYFSPIYNRDDETCFIAYLRATIANSIPKQYRVQPFIYAMKIVKDSIKTLRDDHPSNPFIDIGLCPGVYDSLSENISSPNKEKFLTEFKKNLIEYLSKNEKTNDAPINNDLFWRHVVTPTNEGTYWIEIVTEAINNPLCKYFFDVMHVQFDLSVNTEYTTPSISVSFPPNINIVDKNCVMQLLLALALLPETCSVQVRPKLKLFNSDAQWITQSATSNNRPFFKAGITGRAQTVGVSDTGLDINNCYFKDENLGTEFMEPAQYDAARAKVVYYDPYGDKADTIYGHGTHVCGTIAGNNPNSAAEGIAKNAKLAFVDIGNSETKNLQIPPTDRLLGAARPVVKIHNVAWGTEYPFYASISRNFDSYMYNNPDFLIVTAVGNKDHIGSAISDPATSKNSLVVGATNNGNGGVNGEEKGFQYLAPYSLSGPTRDLRSKPDVVAPGSWMLSAGSLPGVDNECDTPNGLPTPGSEGINGLIFKQGTSMSAAVVAGSAALVRQYFSEGWWPAGEQRVSNKFEPSGALVKAVLMNGAQSLLGVDNGVSGIGRLALYDGAQNFGRINLLNSLYLTNENNVRTAVWDNQRIKDNETMVYQLDYSRAGVCNSKSISITLVWMDPPGAVGCRSCVLNDLNLSGQSLKKPFTKFYPNDLPSEEVTNNAERIIINGLRKGEKISITVKASNLVTADQTFALAASGCISLTQFFEEVNNEGIPISMVIGSVLFVVGTILLGYALLNEARKLSRR